MRPEAGSAYKFRYEEPCKCGDGTSAKCRINEVEPNNVWPKLAHRIQYAYCIAHRTHLPTATNRVARQFHLIRLIRRIDIAKNCKIDVLTAEFLGKVKAVFA